MNKQPELLELKLYFTAYPLSQRIRDDDTIALLCKLLDRGEPLAPVTLGTRELWSSVLRRRIRGRYPKEKNPRAKWIARHYYVRQAFTNETPEQSAQYLARFWSAAGYNVTAATLLSAVVRKKEKLRSLNWISEQEIEAREPRDNGCNIPTTMMVYEALNAGIERIAADFSKGEKVKRPTVAQT